MTGPPHFVQIIPLLCEKESKVDSKCTKLSTKAIFSIGSLFLIFSNCLFNQEASRAVNLLLTKCKFVNKFIYFIVTFSLFKSEIALADSTEKVL